MKRFHLHPKVQDMSASICCTPRARPGSRPRESQQPNPMALEVLRNAGVSTEGLRSKTWDEFGKPDAPHMDLVITVCDSAAGEVCPYWPDHLRLQTQTRELGARS